MNNHIETVSKIYEAFGKGDIPTILTYLADDVRWENWENATTAQQAGVPWLQARRGKDGVLEFFKAVGDMKFNVFNVKSLMAGPTSVAAEVVIDAEIISTGAALKDEEIHLWMFNEQGKVSGFRHYADTARHMQAANVGAAQLQA